MNLGMMMTTEIDHDDWSSYRYAYFWQWKWLTSTAIVQAFLVRSNNLQGFLNQLMC